MQIETETKVSANPCELLLISENLRALIVHFNILAKVFAFADLIRTLTGSQTKRIKNLLFPLTAQAEPQDSQTHSFRALVIEILCLHTNFPADNS